MKSCEFYLKFYVLWLGGKFSYNRLQVNLCWLSATGIHHDSLQGNPSLTFTGYVACPDFKKVVGISFFKE
ncbi:hypothetical protein K2173_014462 [Erythroxylum novogranatense]|uniref:Uncharacterized protein n=1 Tax=Erythroxylum novogranatense TaxID=1862640 RepID=A0AAV8S5B6_9ROSI|nr:hypothetical protein K2173_014462 [Erythroxylum novogranatense]